MANKSREFWINSKLHEAYCSNKVHPEGSCWSYTISDKKLQNYINKNPRFTSLSCRHFPGIEVKPEDHNELLKLKSLPSSMCLVSQPQIHDSTGLPLKHKQVKFSKVFYDSSSHINQFSQVKRTTRSIIYLSHYLLWQKLDTTRYIFSCHSLEVLMPKPCLLLKSGRFHVKGNMRPSARKIITVW